MAVLIDSSVFITLERSGRHGYSHSLTTSKPKSGRVPAAMSNLKKSIAFHPRRGRLAWMIRNAKRLAPRDGAKWREYRRRIIENPRREDALQRLDDGIIHQHSLLRTQHFVSIPPKHAFPPRVYVSQQQDCHENPH